MHRAAREGGGAMDKREIDRDFEKLLKRARETDEKIRKLREDTMVSGQQEYMRRRRQQAKKEEEMKVYRKVKMKTNHIEVGDQIKIKLKGYGTFTATAQKADIIGKEYCVLFLFDNCIDRHCMNETDTTEGGYEESDMNKYLNTEILDAFPDKIRDLMEPFDVKHTYLRLLSENEVFSDDALPLMQDVKNRVCSDTDGCRARWWLRDVAASTTFALVYSAGIAARNYASNSLGVRPAFMLTFDL